MRASINHDALTHLRHRSADARLSTRRRAPFEAKNKPQQQREEAPLPTCAVTAHHHAPAYRMLAWALDSGADLLPPTAPMEDRSRTLERPLHIDTLISYAEKCLKAAAGLKGVYKGHTCGDVDVGAAAKRKGVGGGFFDSTDEDALPFYKQLGAIRGYSAIGGDDEEGEGEGGGNNNQPPLQFILAQRAMLVSSLRRYNKVQQSRGGCGGGHKNISENEEDCALPPPLSLRQHRQLILAAEMAMIRIAKCVEEGGASYIIPLYRHQLGTATNGPSRQLVFSVAAPTTPSPLDSNADHAVAAASAFIQNRTSLLRASLSSADRQREAMRKVTYALSLPPGKAMDARERHVIATAKPLINNGVDAPSSRGKQDNKRSSSVGGRSLATPMPMHSSPSSLSSSPSFPSPLDMLKALNGHYTIPSMPILQAMIADHDRIKRAKKKLKKAIEAARRREEKKQQNEKKRRRNNQREGLSKSGDDDKSCKSDNDEEMEDDTDEEEGSDKSDDEEGVAGEDEEADPTFTLKDFVYTPASYDPPLSSSLSDDLRRTNPSVELRFEADRGVLIAKFALSEAQMKALENEMRERRREKASVNNYGEKIDVDSGPAVGEDGRKIPTRFAKKDSVSLSSSSFLFQSEFVGIAADLWLGVKGPWRGKVMHVVRKRPLLPSEQPPTPAAKKNDSDDDEGEGDEEKEVPRGSDCGANTLLGLPYLRLLSEILDERTNLHQPSSPAQQSGISAAAGAAVGCGSLLDPIDSIVVGQWCFARINGGGHSSTHLRSSAATDPYQCVNCGNTRLADNVAYVSSPTTASSAVRGGAEDNDDDGEGEKGGGGGNTATTTLATQPLRRGKYYCPFCRRATVHMNTTIITPIPFCGGGVAQHHNNGGSSSANSSHPQLPPKWNHSAYKAPPSHKDVGQAPLDPLRYDGPLHSEPINRRLNTMMGLQLI